MRIFSMPASGAKMRMFLWGKVKRKCKVVRRKKALKIYKKGDGIEVKLVPVFEVSL